ncbi:unnamed protein product [Clonostachys rosea]|uniref:Protein kinase domain-containing protein n=1 Tax=Bionectria ochroleuca TaxID=29856 RepID=A0ABY6UKX2_BIOOC|nr:unnamed protein product [Clonostachys rosea]
MAILVLIDRPAKIRLFLEHGTSDTSLPFDQKGVEASECFKSWSRLTVSRFLERQWEVIPYFFNQMNRTTREPIKIGRHILPFLFFDKSRHEGATGEIYRADIHAQQHDFKKLSKSRHFIIKRLHKDYCESRTSFKREFAVLRRFSNNAHPHIVSLLVAYEHSGSCHFVFPEANSTLAEFWSSSSPFESKQEGQLLPWMVQQCRGLAAGLSRLHRHETSSGRSLLNPSSGLTLKKAKSNEHFEIYGWHGDIKPENILWFPGPGKEMGTLKIADFGTAQFSIKLRSHRKPLGYSPTYSAPEFKFRNPENLINALCDVWALGCVYLEALTWAIAGRKLHDHLMQSIKEAPDPGWYGESESSGKWWRTDFFFMTPCNSDGEKGTPFVKPIVTEICCVGTRAALILAEVS